MKLITLNMWGGRVKEPLTDFLKKHSDVDVFLFQEIIEGEGDEDAPKERADVPEILSGHKGYFAPALSNGFGLGAFIKKDVTVEREGDVFVHSQKDAAVGKEWWLTVGKNMQFVEVTSKEGKTYTIFGLHGIWEPTGKSDTAIRLKQSERIIDFIKKFKGPIILCGDFNLRPDTESIKMIERELGLKNLITEYGVTSTRTSLYTKTAERFADYIFVSPGLEVKEFAVLPDEVSDHAALYLEFL